MIKQNEGNKMAENYDEYYAWKKGLNDWGDFFDISDFERSELLMQFSESNIEFKNKDVLELGFGSGKVLKFLKEEGCNVSGVEVQTELLTLAESQGIRVYKDCSKVNEKFDLIVGFDVLEHMDVQQLRDFFRCASTILRVDGKMLFRFPNGDSYAGLAAQNGDFTHLTTIGKMKLNQIIQPCGLKILSFEGRVDFPKKIIKSFLLKLARWPFIKLYGFGNNHFFSGSVIAVIGHADGDN